MLYVLLLKFLFLFIFDLKIIRISFLNESDLEVYCFRYLRVINFILCIFIYLINIIYIYIFLFENVDRIFFFIYSKGMKKMFLVCKIRMN